MTAPEYHSFIDFVGTDPDADEGAPPPEVEMVDLHPPAFRQLPIPGSLFFAMVYAHLQDKHKPVAYENINIPTLFKYQYGHESAFSVLESKLEFTEYNMAALFDHIKTPPGTWTTAGGDVLVSDGGSSLESQIANKLQNAYRHRNTNGPFDVLIENALEDLIMSCSHSEGSVFGIWLMTHPDIFTLITRVFFDIMWMFVWYDQKTGATPNLNAMRPDRHLYPTSDPLQKIKDFKKIDSIWTKAFVYPLGKVSSSYIKKIWTEYLESRNRESNPFWVLQQEINLLFADNAFYFNEENVTKMLTFSKAYFVWYLSKEISIFPRDIQFSRHKILAIIR